MMDEFRARIEQKLAEAKGDYWFHSRPSASSPLHVLGYGVPLNHEGGWSLRQPLWNSSLHWKGEPLLRRERRMMAMMGEITDKPNWPSKILDAAIVQRWRQELAESEQILRSTLDDRTEYPVHKFSEAMFAFCMEELAEYASQLGKNGFFPAIDGTAAAYKSDTIIPEELKRCLQKDVKPLEDVPDEDKDYHPFTNDLVLDLVHPSICPLLYGRSKIIPQETIPLDTCFEFVGKGVVVPSPSEEEVCRSEKFSFFEHPPTRRHGGKELWSRRFQWLPCEVAFMGTDQVKITSYINNLHPLQHRILYRTIEEVMGKAIPMWNATLTSMQRPTRQIERPGEKRRWSRQGQFGRFYIEGKLYDDNRFSEEGGWEEEEDPDDVDAYQDRRDGARLTWALGELESLEPVSWKEYRASRTFDESELKLPVYRGLEQPIDLRKDFAEDGLQVIVKLANIHLTPEKPRYGGGSWHVEGQLNERICASALYYYDSRNITESSLAFRQRVDVEALEPIPGQEEYNWVERAFGVEQHKDAVQDLGRVKTPEGRLLTFINGFQHQVQPFELADATQPGHRKLLALFLVNPFVRIPSTANVPPQQKAWAKSDVMTAASTGALSAEPAEGNLENLEGLIDRDEAERLREDLINERGGLNVNVEQHGNREFSFCEH